MSGATWIVFALSAGLGAVCRFLLDGVVEARTRTVHPMGTLVVNAAGSLLLGVLTALGANAHVSDDALTVLGVGFCGALTTFSTFAVQTVRLMENGETEAALKNVGLNTAVSIALAAAGYAAVLSST